MAIRLIVNSDDYGRTLEVSRGVREAHLNGIVTSTTSMMNMPPADECLRLAMQETPRLGLGVHLVLTSGKPLLPAAQVNTLVDGAGFFLRPDKLMQRLGQIEAAQAKAEWRAQIEKFVAVRGAAPTHLDSHHHSSYFSEGLFRGMLELAAEYGCGIRLVFAQGQSGEMMGFKSEQEEALQAFAARLLREFSPRTPDVFYASFYDEHATEEELLGILQNLADGTAEVMCHPGYTDPVLMAESIYNRQREGEISVLTAPRIRQAVQERHIQLISFAEL